MQLEIAEYQLNSMFTISFFLSVALPFNFAGNRACFRLVSGHLTIPRLFVRLSVRRRRPKVRRRGVVERKTPRRPPHTYHRNPIIGPDGLAPDKI